MKLGDKVVYQIYPKSYYDSNDDGFGDIKGITMKLEYLSDLGVDMIWLNPFFVSPQNDNGYDIADYYEIDKTFGTMADVEELIAKANGYGIGLMFDMVLNHTSTEHEWFKKALAGDEYYKDFYFFKKGKGSNPPTNWESKFGGSCWEYVEEFDEYYLHLFDKTQADLNWNNPDVRKEMANIVNFWIDKGVKGFRFDVINLISKDSFEDDFEGVGKRFYTDGINVGPYLHELGERSFNRYDDIMTVGEMSATSIEKCSYYTNPENRILGMTFNFHHLKVDYQNNEKWTLAQFDFQELKELFHTWQIGMQENNGWSALFYNCHDQPRAISRFGDDKNYPYQSATMLATSIHLQRGTPYIYYGEEIGMTNNYFETIEQYRDVESLNHYEIMKRQGISEERIIEILQAKSRDNGRSPMQWDDGVNSGFSKVKPWMEINGNYTSINKEAAVHSDDSIYHYYRKLIDLRKKSELIQNGSYLPLLVNHDSVYAFKRYDSKSELIVLCNFYGKKTELDIDLTDYRIILGNYESSNILQDNTMQEFETVVLLKNHGQP